MVPSSLYSKRGVGTDNQVGYDASKHLKGRKIHALFESEGLPMWIAIHSAAIQDRDRAGLRQDTQALSLARLIWADGGYNV